MRILTPELSAALLSKVVTPIYMMRFEHPLGTLRVWTGIGELQYDGFPWTGSGSVISVSPIEDGTELRVMQAVFTMPAPDVMEDALAIILSPVTRIPIYRWLAFLDSNSNVIPDPILRGKFYGDPPKITDDANGNRIVMMNVEGAVFNLTRSSGTLLSNEEQLARFPDDTGLSQMAEVANQQLTWTAGAYNSFTPPP